MNYGPLILLAIAVLIWYILFVFPQQKRAKERQAVIDSVKTGDEIVTYGGIFAVVKDIQENWVIVTVADGVDMKIAKEAIVMRREAGMEDHAPAEKKSKSKKNA
ncbi:MAG: preprotein translocase subunit YajC [Actinomycetota bacterium]